MTPDQKEIDAAMDKLAEARHAGRPIVPLIGGGLSAESGVLTTEALVHYLAALRFYVRERIYLPDSWRTDKNHPLAPRAKDYERSLLEFVKDFGWPDPNQLTASLWQAQAKEVGWDLDAEIRHQLDLLAEEIYPERVAAFGEAVPGERARASRRWDAVAHWTDLVRHVTRFDPDYAASLFTRMNLYRRPGVGHRFLAFLPRLCSMRLFLTTNLDPLLRHALAAEGVAFRAYNLGGGRPFPPPALLRNEVSILNLFGQDDRPVLDEQHELPLGEQFFAGLRQATRGDQAPLLLVVGCSGRGRRFMDLIERGFLLNDKRLPVAPPHNGPAVVWLHYEDSLPRPVRQFYLKDERYRPLIVTAGVKNPGLFLRQLYFTLSSRYPASAEPYPALEQRPALLSQDPPVSQELPKDGRTPEAGRITRWSNDAGTVVLFDSFHSADERAPYATATEQLTAWMNAQDGLNPIWINLAAEYTIAGVVGTVIDQCRLYDPMLAPSVLPLGDLELDEQPHRTTRRGGKGQSDHSRAIARAAARLAEALSRGRYAVAFDSPEAFAWPQTTHHGTVTPQSVVDRRRIEKRIMRLFRIFLVLTKQYPLALKGSRLGISINPPAGRHAVKTPSPQLEKLLKGFREHMLAKKQWFISWLKLSQETILVAGEPDPPDQVGGPPTTDCSLSGLLVGHRDPAANAHALTSDSARLALLALSCFRRTRTLVALRAVLGPLARAAPWHETARKKKENLGPYSAVDDVLDWYCANQYLVPVEGGLYWMKRPFRDRIYESNSQHTETDEVCKVFAAAGLDAPDKTMAQLILLALHHDRIARQYYFETYVQSKDPPAFFEYVYHRVSSIRYLTKLHLVLESLPKDALEVAGVCKLLKEVILGNEEYLGLDSDAQKRLKEPKEFAEEVGDRRLREIASLRIAWAASQETLSAQVPAEQLISWCKWLIENDLPRFRTAYYRKRVPDDQKELKAAANSSLWEGRCRALDKDTTDACRKLRDTLFAHWVQCCRERGDHRAVAQVCGIYFSNVGEDLNEWLAGAAEPPTEEDKEEVNKFQKELKALEAAAKEGAADAMPGRIDALSKAAASAAARKALGDHLYRGLMDRLLDLAERHPPPAGQEEENLKGLADLLKKEEHTLFARFCLLQAGYHVQRLSFAEQRVLPPTDGDPPAAQDRLKEDLKHVHKMEGWTKRGLTEIRHIDYLQQQNPEPGSYFYYRTRFLLYRGRGRWLRTLADPDASAREEAFKQAYQDLELARGRLEPGASRTFLAQIDLASAETVLAQAAPEMDRQSSLARAGAKLDIADGYLRRVLDHLLHGRRNVVWWREYTRVRAQYLADRNLWRLQDLLQLDRCWERKGGAEPLPFAERWQFTKLRDRVGPTLRQFVRTLRQGFLAVGYGRALELQGADSGATPWVRAALWELVFTALWLGVVIPGWSRRNAPPFTGPDPYFNRKEWSKKDVESIKSYVMHLASECGAKLPQKKPKQLEEVCTLVCDQAVAETWDASPRNKILRLAKEAGSIAKNNPRPPPPVSDPALG